VIFGHQWPNNFGRGDKNHSEFGLQIAKYLKDAPKPNPPIIGFPQDFPPVRRYTGGCEYVTIPTMHERAILTSTHASLGLAGDLVFIASLEELFKTSADANAAATFKCADGRCGVKVSA
jgi:hypothetical protein